MFGRVALIAAVAGGAYLFCSSNADTDAYDLSAVAVPELPEMPVAVLHEHAARFDVEFGGPEELAGHTGKLVVLLPDPRPRGEQLPLMLAAASGMGFVAGANVTAADVDDVMTFVKAGIAVVLYSVDGVPDGSVSGEAAASQAFQAFRRSFAGLVNARNAHRFALARLPVDPQRVYTIGAAESGGLALLYAEHMPLAGAIALLPELSIHDAFGANAIRKSRPLLQGLVELSHRASPYTHIRDLSGHVFIGVSPGQGDVAGPPNDGRDTRRELSPQERTNAGAERFILRARRESSADITRLALTTDGKALLAIVAHIKGVALSKGKTP